MRRTAARAAADACCCPLLVAVLGGGRRLIGQQQCSCCSLCQRSGAFSSLVGQRSMRFVVLLASWVRSCACRRCCLCPLHCSLQRRLPDAPHRCLCLLGRRQLALHLPKLAAAAVQQLVKLTAQRTRRGAAVRCRRSRGWPRARCCCGRCNPGLCMGGRRACHSLLRSLGCYRRLVGICRNGVHAV